ncbi:MAG TPA: PBSX family phage terminase large subunit [Elusimicrobiales bacterium]|nr:PBSX family phage terminase large subunit [Elusimicrobiales bacterium]
MSDIKTKITNVFKRNFYSLARTVVNIGGARSSKSHSIAQLLIFKADTERNKNIGITRKTMPALKMTSYRLVIDLLKSYGLYNPKNHNKTEDYYELNSNRINFFSLDDPEKIKSTEFNYIWMEEANEFNYRDYITLLTRLSGKTNPKEKNKMFLSLNPSEANSWIAKKLIAQKNIEVIKSTYKDNPFINTDYIKILEDLKNQDENYYRIYALGQWGMSQNLVYSNYEFTDKLPCKPDETIWGLDFGYNNPSSLVRVDFKDRTPHIRQYLYETGLTNADIIVRLKKIIPQKNRHHEIFADSAEPDRIAEISREGFNIHPANKSVLAGIDTLKRFKLHITKDSANLIKEIQSYKWKTNSSGKSLEEPVKFNDHALDAVRYAIHSYIKKQGMMPEIITF